MQLTMRPSRASILVLAVPFLVAAVLCAIAAVRRPAMWSLVLVWLCLAFGWAAWIWSHRLEISSGELRYSAPFRRTVTVRLEEIATARVEIGEERYWDRFKPPFRLAVAPTRQSAVKPFWVNLKVFRRDEVSVLLRELVPE